MSSQASPISFATPQEAGDSSRRPEILWPRARSACPSARFRIASACLIKVGVRNRVRVGVRLRVRVRLGVPEERNGACDRELLSQAPGRQRGQDPLQPYAKVTVSF